MKFSTIFSLIIALLLIAAAAFLSYTCFYAAAGQPPVYHESWSPERRADIERLQEIIHKAQNMPAPQEQTEAHKTRLTPQNWQEIHDMLSQVAASGRGDVYTADGLSAAHFAAHQSMPELLRELVLRGASPNAAHPSESGGPESVFQAAICCAPIIPADTDEDRLSQPERLELLGWLLEHGADINRNSARSLMLAYMADVMDEKENEEDSIPGATMEWLLDHGLSPQQKNEHEPMFNIIQIRGSLPCVQRFMKKGYLDLHNPQVINALLSRAAAFPEDDSAQKVRWLLALGADAGTAMPACCANVQLYGDSGDPDDAVYYNAALQVLDALLTYGAELPDPARICPKVEPQKSSFLELLQQHHIVLDAPV